VSAWYRYLGPMPLPVPEPGQEMRATGRRFGGWVELSHHGTLHMVPAEDLQDARLWKPLVQSAPAPAEEDGA